MYSGSTGKQEARKLLERLERDLLPPIPSYWPKGFQTTVRKRDDGLWVLEHPDFPPMIFDRRSMAWVDPLKLDRRKHWNKTKRMKWHRWLRRRQKEKAQRVD